MTATVHVWPQSPIATDDSVGAMGMRSPAVRIGADLTVLVGGRFPTDAEVAGVAGRLRAAFARIEDAALARMASGPDAPQGAGDSVEAYRG